jgi:phosphoglycolate phosphatase-like HAD superfamily hydrolase
MLKKIVFDFDGTVADTFQQIVVLIKKVRPDLSEKEIEIYRELGARKAKKEFKISLKEVFRIMKLVKEKQKNVIEKAEAFAGIKEIIEELRKRKIEVGILSSNSKENIEKWLAKETVMVDWVRSESTIFGKEKAIIKVKSNDMLYVGDEVRDVEACHKIGVKIAAVIWGYNSKKALIKTNPDYLVESLKELRNLLLTLSQ